jgi:hypothetical protein
MICRMLTARLNLSLRSLLTPASYSTTNIFLLFLSYFLGCAVRERMKLVRTFCMSGSIALRSDFFLREFLDYLRASR